MKKIIIVGIGKFAEIADFYFRNDANRDVICFAVSNQETINRKSKFKDRPVYSLSYIFSSFKQEDVEIFVAIGYRKMNAIRKDICKIVKKHDFDLANYISTKATYLSDYKIGENSFIFEDNTIQPFVEIGKGVILWSGNHIGHHTVIEDWVFVSSHVVISGNCKIGEASFLGVNSTIADGINIEQKNLIGPGALIQKNTSFEDVWLSSKSNLFTKPSSFFFK